MAVPANPTAAIIATEGFKKALIPNPSSTQLTRATDIWMEEIKNDIANIPAARKLKSLTVKTIAILTKGRAWLDRPDDFQSDMKMELLDGVVSNTAQSGSASSITLNASETIPYNDIIGKEILITAGTAIGSYSEVVDYDITTKIATVSPTFTTVPANGDTYLVVTAHSPLDPTPVWGKGFQTNPLSIAKPTKYYPVGDDDNGEFRLNSVPDKTYGLLLQYYADLQKIDLDSTRMTTLYRKWRNVFTMGIYVRILNSTENDKEAEERQNYNSAILRLVSAECDGYDLSNITCQVSDY